MRANGGSMWQGLKWPSDWAWCLVNKWQECRDFSPIATRGQLLPTTWRSWKMTPSLRWDHNLSHLDFSLIRLSRGAGTLWPMATWETSWESFHGYWGPFPCAHGHVSSSCLYIILLLQGSSLVSTLPREGSWVSGKICVTFHEDIKTAQQVLWDAFSSEAKPVLKSISRKFPNWSWHSSGTNFMSAYWYTEESLSLALMYT